MFSERGSRFLLKLRKSSIIVQLSKKRMMNQFKSLEKTVDCKCSKIWEIEYYVSHCRRNPAFAYVKTKAQISCTVKLLHMRSAADQHLYFRFKDSTTVFVLLSAPEGT